MLITFSTFLSGNNVGWSRFTLFREVLGMMFETVVLIDGVFTCLLNDDCTCLVLFVEVSVLEWSIADLVVGFSSLCRLDDVKISVG